MKNTCDVVRIIVASMQIRLFCFIVVAASICSNSAPASVVSLAPGTNPAVIDRTGNGQAYTLSISLTDWLLGSGNKKLGGGITTTGPSATNAFNDYPDFIYSNGTSPTSSAGENGFYRFSNSPFTISIPLTVGSGQVTLWLGSQSNTNTASFTADFPDTAGTDFSAFFATSTNSEQWFLNYTSSVAQTMTVTLNPNGNGNVGFFAVGVGQVPEPSTTALFAFAGVIGLFHARNRRNRA